MDTSGFSRLCVKGSWDSKASSAQQGSTWGALVLWGIGFFLAVMEGERSKVYSPYLHFHLYSPPPHWHQFGELGLTNLLLTACRPLNEASGTHS